MGFPAAAIIPQHAAITKDFDISTSGRSRGYARAVINK
jgi:hypothetical protein